MFTRLLVAFDGSDLSRRALDVGIELAQRLGAGLYSICAEDAVVVPATVPGYGPTESDDAEGGEAESGLVSLSEEARQLALAKGVAITATIISGEDDADAILDAISATQCDLLIIGLPNRSSPLEGIFPHTSTILEHMAPCSVLGIR